MTCGLDASVCNDKQRWNNHKRRCESKQLADNGRCDCRFITILVYVNVNVINHVKLENN